MGLALLDFLNPNLTWEFIKDNLNKPWCWKNISSHPNITS